MAKKREEDNDIINIPIRYFLIVLLFILTIAILYFLISSDFFGGEKRARESLLNFFSENYPNKNIEVISVTKEGYFYYFELRIDGDEIQAYVTKDGKYATPILIPIR
ncbi:MAG: hypothetical protein QXU40_01835 [Candidatus Pacearchaeota archaeon]